MYHSEPSKAFRYTYLTVFTVAYLNTMRRDLHFDAFHFQGQLLSITLNIGPTNNEQVTFRMSLIVLQAQQQLRASRIIRANMR